jgi:hypothetical protein
VANVPDLGAIEVFAKVSRAVSDNSVYMSVALAGIWQLPWLIAHFLEIENPQAAKLLYNL